MQQIVSITSQGQISIPAKMRRMLGLDVSKKVYVTQEGGKIIVEPVKDIMSFKGAFHSKALKNKSIEEIMELEQEAILKARLEKYLD